MRSDAAKEKALAHRKAQLLLDGAVYRIGIVQAKTNVLQSLHAETLVRNVGQHLLGVIGMRLNNLFTPNVRKVGGQFQTLMPLAVTAFTFLSGKKLLKPVIGGGLLLTAVGAVVALALRRKRPEIDGSYDL